MSDLYQDHVWKKVQWNLDLRKPDLRKIVATTDFLVPKLFDLRTIDFLRPNVQFKKEKFLKMFKR